MESNQHEDSKSCSSNEESDRSEQSNDDMGTGRSYECVFCKRGFTTAQALGGHMNIHRKDRAKTRPIISSSSVSSKVLHDHEIKSYPLIQSYPPQYYSIAAPHDHNDQVHVNYQTFFPAVPTWRPSHTDDDDNLYVQNSQYNFKPYGEDWRGTLSLQVGDPSRVVVDDDNNEKRVAGSEEEDQLDLELRLGYDP